MSNVVLSKINEGDKLILKKNHACGCNTFAVVKRGADFKLECLACGHVLLLDAVKVQKNAQKHFASTTIINNCQ